MSIQEEITKQLVSKLHQEFENTFKEGLKLKGFEFDSKIDFENFISKNCRCEDYQAEKRRVYFVNEIPFFVHYYEPVFEPFQFENNSVTLKANQGTYKFV